MKPTKGVAWAQDFSGPPLGDRAGCAGGLFWNGASPRQTPCTEAARLMLSTCYRPRAGSGDAAVPHDVRFGTASWVTERHAVWLKAGEELLPCFRGGRGRNTGGFCSGSEQARPLGGVGRPCISWPRDVGTAGWLQLRWP